MRDKGMSDNISFDLNMKIIKEFNNNMSSGESHEYSISFEPESIELLNVYFFKEEVNKKRLLRKKNPEILK